MKSFSPYSCDFERNLRWKDRHRGEKCILMCNGPSLNKVDFSRIDRDEYQFVGLNKIYMGFKQFNLKTDYIISVNKKVLLQSADIFRNLKIVKFISNRVSPEILPQNPYTFYLKTRGIPKNPLRFNPDITEYVHEGWTVTHVALQVLYFMGFKRVNIIGMDHHFTQHEEGKENQTSIIEGDDLDHFHPDYFGNGKEWDLPDLKNSEISYMKALEVYTLNNREIVDYTIGGACQIFPKRDIGDLYGKKKIR